MRGLRFWVMIEDEVESQLPPSASDTILPVFAAMQSPGR